MSRWWLVLWSLFTGYGLAVLVYDPSWFWAVVTTINASGVLFWFYTEKRPC